LFYETNITTVIEFVFVVTVITVIILGLIW